MVVKGTLRCLLDTRSPFALCRIVERALEVARGSYTNFERAVQVETIVKQVIIVADCRNRTNDQLSPLDCTKLAETIVVTVSVSMARQREVHVGFEDADSVSVGRGTVAIMVGKVPRRRAE